MKRNQILIWVLIITVALVLAGAVGMALAQSPAGGDAALAVDPGDVPAVVPIQGRLLDSSGNPINGTRSVVFTLYSAATGGSVKCTDTQNVTAVNGLFNAAMHNCTSAVFDGRELWLGIKVGSDAEMTPRQPIYAVPFAWSLRPGAYIEEVSEELGTGMQIRTRGEGSIALKVGGTGQYNKALEASVGGEVGSIAVKASASGQYSYAGYFNNTGGGTGIYAATGSDWLLGPAVKAEATNAAGIALQTLANSSKPSAIVQNSGGGIGAHVISAGAGLNGPALKAEAKNAAGVAVRAVVTSTDASVVIENMGAGALLKAFGAGGGEDELRINNDGSLETRADSYIFAPGTEATINVATTGVTLGYGSFGSVTVDPSTTGAKVIQFGITLPAVLYGQPVKVEEITVFYMTNNVTSFISRTRALRAQAGAFDFDVMADSTTPRSSTTWTSYSLTPTANNTLSANTGFVTVELTLDFFSASHLIYIGGVRVRLGHHDLY